MAITKGSYHLGLTVPNITQTRNFFVDILGFEEVGKVPDYPAIFSPQPLSKSSKREVY